MAFLPSPFDNFPPTRKKDTVSVGLITTELFLHISSKSGNPNDDPEAWETPTNGEKDDRDLRVCILLLAYQAVAHMAMSSCMQGTEVSDLSLGLTDQMPSSVSSPAALSKASAFRSFLACSA